MRAALLAILLFLPAMVSGSSTEWIKYVRITLADPAFQGKEVFETFFVDEERGVAYAGHVGIITESCSEGWACQAFGFMSIVVPVECRFIDEFGGWEYAGKKYVLSGLIDPNEDQPENQRRVLEVRGMKGELEGVVVYSTNRGLESFSLIEGKGRRRSLISYYLSSQTGILTGGCVGNHRHPPLE